MSCIIISKFTWGIDMAQGRRMFNKRRAVATTIAAVIVFFLVIAPLSVCALAADFDADERQQNPPPCCEVFASEECLPCCKIDSQASGCCFAVFLPPIKTDQAVLDEQSGTVGLENSGLKSISCFVFEPPKM